MNYPRIFLILGLLVILIPFFGIPLVWKHIVTVVLGVLVISFAILLRSSTRAASPMIRQTLQRARKAIPTMPRRSSHTARVPKGSMNTTPEVPTTPVEPTMISVDTDSHEASQ